MSKYDYCCDDIQSLIQLRDRLEKDLTENPVRPKEIVRGATVYSVADNVRKRAYEEICETLDGIQNLLSQTQGIVSAYKRICKDCEE